VNWTVSFNEFCGAAVVKTGGVFNVSDHRLMVEDIVTRDEWKPGQRILFDHRALDWGGARLEDMTSARDNHAAHEDRIRNARSAILMKSAADYGLGRQFQSLADGTVSAELGIFADEASAKDWLCAPDEALRLI
jgi:hypothetical protein